MSEDARGGPGSGRRIGPGLVTASRHARPGTETHERNRLARFLLPVCLLAAVACGGSDGGGGEDPPPVSVSFELDLKPILDADCIHCHGGAGGLDLESYSGLMAGGVSGPVVVAGDAAGSLLIQRLDGTILPTMPRDGPALSGAEIARFAQWITEGAADN